MHRVFASINILLAASLLAWPAALFLAMFMFDAPGSEKDPVLLAFAMAILAYPAPIVLANVMFWSKRKTTATRQLLHWTLVGCVSPLVFLLFCALIFSR